MAFPRGRLVWSVCILGIGFTVLSVLEDVDDYVAYWPFDEGEGLVAYDTSANGYRGDLYEPAWSAGIAGGALVFDGVGDYVDFRDGDTYPEAIGALSVGTISVWFTFDSFPPVLQIHPIFYLGDGVQPYGPISSAIIEVGHFQTSARLYFSVIIDADVPLCFDTDFDLEIGRWYHFAVVVGDDFNTGYLDGEELTDRHYTFGGPSDSYFFADIPDKQEMWAGRGFLNGINIDQYHQGRIDELRIFDRPLSAEEIYEYYETVPEPASSGCLLLGCLVLGFLERRRSPAAAPSKDSGRAGYLDRLGTRLELPGGGVD